MLFVKTFLCLAIPLLCVSVFFSGNNMLVVYIGRWKLGSLQFILKAIHIRSTVIWSKFFLDLNNSYTGVGMGHTLHLWLHCVCWFDSFFIFSLSGCRLKFCIIELIGWDRVLILKIFMDNWSLLPRYLVRIGCFIYSIYKNLWLVAIAPCKLNGEPRFM